MVAGVREERPESREEWIWTANKKKEAINAQWKKNPRKITKKRITRTFFTTL